MDREQADAQLAEIESIVARVKQSRIYRVAGDICMVWGVVNLVRYAYFHIAPLWAGSSWYVVDIVGILVTLGLVHRARAGRGGGGLWRVGVAFLLFYGFGWIWSNVLGDFGWRQTSAFWPTLFLFGYSLAGLWFGLGFTALGLSLTSLIVVGYAFAGDYYPLWLAISTGGGFLLCGLWMRRA